MTEDELRPRAEEMSSEADAPDSQEGGDAALAADGLDIEAALAAVAELGDIAEQEAEEAAESQAITPAAEATAEAAEAEAEEAPAVAAAPMPELFTLTRGQAASTVPSLILIVVGVWLTLSLAGGDSALNATVGFGIVAGGVGLSLLSYWQTTAGWARGSFFLGFVSLLLGAGGVFLLRDAAQAAQLWPLLWGVVGLGFWATALFTQPKDGGLFKVGLIALVMGGVGYAGTSGLLPNDLVQFVGGLWPLVAGVAVMLWALPQLLGRKGR